MTGIQTGWLAVLALVTFLLLPAAAAVTNCSDVETSPVVDFRYDVVASESAPIMVNFYSTSEGGRNEKGGIVDPVDTYTWQFGDGDSSLVKNPLHTFAMSSARYEAEARPFAVSLMVTTTCGRSNATVKNVSVYCLGQNAAFTIVRPVGEGPYNAPVAVNLQDTSLHVPEWVTTWHYTLWDAGMTRLYKESTEKDPTFVITHGGSYVIRQEIYKGCSNPSPNDSVMTMNIEVKGSAASDAIPMETIPPAPTVPENPATTPQAAVSTPAETPATIPAPVPASSGTGTLSVITTPDGARVFVNNVLVGSSPVTQPGFVPGSYQLRLEKSGYRNKTVRFEIADGRTTEYATALETESALPGFVPILAAVVIVAAGAGAVYWFMKKRKKKPVKVDWNKPD